ISQVNAGFTAISSNDTLWVHANYLGVPNAAYSWNFGDGGHATGKDTMHIYADTVYRYMVKLSVTNVCGTASGTDTIKIIVPEPPAHLDLLNTNITVVPNPVTKDYIDAFYNAFTDDNYLAGVYNELGQKMFEEYFAFKSGINEFRIDVSGYSDGIYILVLQSGNSYIRKKFCVRRTP
ncbi:MAG TPA: PKD domain-containing protein, partial [Bacteroidia bacterium]|nr:PKD domain-containing protein [Bacteroidia bacterium]